MPALKKISNTNQSVADKVNYFIDRFTHSNQYGGYEFHLEIENQLSLIEKIYFNLNADPNYKREIFEVYFSHEIINKEDLWTEFPSYKKVLPVFKSYLAATKKERPRILDSSSFNRDLESLTAELRHQMPDVLFNALMSNILCKYGIHEHQHIEKLDFISRMIVSEGLFSGKSMTEISEIVDRIFNKQEKNFPYPSEIKKSQRKKYISENNLRNQLSGFKRLMQKNNTKGIVVMKAFAVETFPDDFFLNYRGVSFFGKNHPKIVKLKSELEQDRDFSVFFESGNFIFVAAKLEYFSFSSIHEQMKFIVSDQLSYLSAALYSEVQLDKRKNFLVLNSKWKKVGYNINLQEGKIHFSANRLNSLHDNPFTILSKTRNSQAKDWFLNYEPIFIQAFKNNNISMMWQYLEALLPSDDKGEKQIKSLVPTLLLLNEKFNARQRVIKTLYDSLDFLSGGSELLNIPFEDLSSIRKLLEKDKVHPSIIQSDYPFIMELVRVLNTEIDEANTVNITTYYKSILIEAYNIRNFDIHSGKADLKSMLKIQRTLPRMIVRLRWIIMDEIKENPHVPFHILISTLIKKAQKMN